MKRNRPIKDKDNEGDKEEGHKIVDDDEEEEEEEENGNDDSEYEDTSSSSDDDDEYDDPRRTLLFLCEEGLIDKALQRVRKWDELYPPRSISSLETNADGVDHDTTTRLCIQKQLFQKNPRTGNYCLHEIVAGGICGERSAPELVRRLLARYGHNGDDDRTTARNTIFAAQPPDSKGRTVLHWCAWSKVPTDILHQVIVMNPDCLLLHDHRTHGARTPYDIAKRYWGTQDTNTLLLQSLRKSYLPYRIQYHVHLCINRIFNVASSSASTSTATATSTPTATPTSASKLTSIAAAAAAAIVAVPFNPQDRKRMKLKPKIWFVASVIAYTKQRSMETLASHIVSYMGYGSISKRKTTKNQNRKMTRKRCCSTNTNNPNKNKRAWKK